MAKRTTIGVTLSEEEMEQLREIADRETRTPGLQAQYMLKMAIRVDKRMHEEKPVVAEEEGEHV